MLWGYIGSLGMPELEEMKSLTSSQGVVLFSGLLDLSPSWGFLGRIWKESWNAGWRSNIWHCGVALVVHRDRPGNWSLALMWLHQLEYCSLIGHNPGVLLACSLDITPWEDIYIYYYYYYYYSVALVRELYRQSGRRRLAKLVPTFAHLYIIVLNNKPTASVV